MKRAFFKLFVAGGLFAFIIGGVAPVGVGTGGLFNGFTMIACAANEIDASLYSEQIQEVKNHIINHDEHFSVTLYCDEIPDRMCAETIFNSAVAHTGNPTEGDWLKWHLYSVERVENISQVDSGYEVTCNFTVTYNATADQVHEANEKSSAIIADLDLENKNDREKIYEIYNYVCQNVTYDFTRLEDASTETEHSAFAALCEHRAVCQGYALSIYNLMLDEGIDCRIVTGKLSGVDHAWNIVRLNDKYYYLDATNDAYKDNYDFFLVSGNELSDYTIDEEFVSDDFRAIYPITDTEDKGIKRRLLPDDDGYISTSGSYGDNVIWILTADGVLTIQGDGKMEEATDRYMTLNGDLMTGYPWRSYSSDVDSIIIEEGISELPDNSFAFMQNADSIVLPATVVSVTNLAFDGSHMDIIVSADNPCFSSKSGMLLNKEGNVLISWPSAEGEVTIPEGIERISDYAFFHPFYPFAAEVYVSQEDKEITGLVLPKSLIEIGTSGFGGRYKIKKVLFKNDNTEIHSNAFSFCRELSEINLPKNLSIIEIGAFNECGFTNIEIPENVTIIDKDAFYRCPNLNNVVIPERVTEIDNFAFGGCASLSNITIPASIRKFGAYCFKDTPFEELHKQNDMLIINDVLVSYTGTNETVIVPDGIKDTCAAFYWNTNVKTVVMPESLETLYHYFAFFAGMDDNGEKLLNTVIFRSDYPGECDTRYGDWLDGYLYPNKRAVIYYPANSQGWDKIDFSHWDDLVELGVEREVKDFHVPYCHLTENYEVVVEHSYADEPVWIWGDDCSAASAVFTCSQCGYERTEEATITTSLSETGDRPVYMAKVIVEGKEYTDRHEGGSAIQGFELAGANMNLGNALAMNFYINKSDIDISKEYYVEIRKDYVGGTTAVRRIPMSKWSSYNDKLYKVVFNGIAAKEMNDRITVQVFEKDGTAVSQLREDSVVAYVKRALESQTPYVQTAMVDMLNYGAAAQKALEYDEDNLANSWLSDAQKAYASEAATGTNAQKKIKNYQGCNLNLGSNLCMNMYFTTLDPEKYNTMYAVLTYTNHNGKECSIRVDGSKFMKYSDTLTNVRVEVLAVAEVNSAVECKVYSKNGNALLGHGIDSIGGYIARQTQTNEVFDAIMKFSKSAYKCFHPNTN